MLWGEHWTQGIRLRNAIFWCGQTAFPWVTWQFNHHPKRAQVIVGSMNVGYDISDTILVFKQVLNLRSIPGERNFDCHRSSCSSIPLPDGPPFVAGCWYLFASSCWKINLGIQWIALLFLFIVFYICIYIYTLQLSQGLTAALWWLNEILLK